MASLRFVRPLRSRTVTPLGVALLALACACATGPAPARDDGDAATDGDEPIETDVDIAVVGAGLSGLRAAQHLSAAGFEVVVLEARDRVGGRTLSVPMAAGAVAEAGGQWIGPTQTAVLGLAEELGVATFADHNQGDTVLVFGGMRFTQAGGQPPSPATQAAFAAIDSEASEVPLESPWLAPEASARDAITVADWLAEAGLDAETRETLELGVQSIMGTTTERVSWLYFLFYVHSAGSVNDLFESAQSLRLHGGAHSLSLRLADQLGAALWTSEPVARIVDHGSHVELQHPSGPTTAKRVVLAMSPQAADAIEFEPRLPRERERLQRRWVAEPGAKAHLVYATPFWRDAGLSGEAFGDLPGVALTHDNSGPEANNPGEGPGVLLAFLELNELPRNADARREAVIEAAVAYFGPAAGEPLDYHEFDWGDEAWTAGCVPALPPGVLTRYGATLREPVGLIHWAGTETALQWTGYMEGAVRAGERVAAELIAAEEAPVGGPR